jgi:two-component system, NtrC family, sensor kinase
MRTLSLRWRLIAGFLVAILTTVFAALLVGAWVIADGLSAQAQDKARLDLNSARLIAQSSLERLGDRVRIMALEPELQQLVRGHAEQLAPELDRLRRRERFDAFNLADASGRLLVRSRPGAAAPGLGEQLPLSLRRVISGRDVVTATLVLTQEQLRREGPDLAELARIPISGTGRECTSGLMYWASAAVTGPHGELRGILVAGKLLNRETQIVGAIRETVYQGHVRQGRQVGEATLFLDDVRVATTLELPGGQRALGTRIDPAVGGAALAGLKRVARADVTGETHVAAYEPLRDNAGKIVGLIGVGMPEKVYVPGRLSALMLFIGLTLLGVLVSVGIAGVVAHRLQRPIEALVAAHKDLGGGKLDRRVEPDRGVREFALLGEGFNHMAAAISERDLRLKYRTQEQLGRSERLAMIGRLAAGVAHEINNPLGGIMLFSNLLLKKAPAEGKERESLERICHEAKRCQKIVQGLLDFARHRELKKEPVDLQEVLDKTLGLVQGQAIFQNVQVTKEYGATGHTVSADATQMEQVFLNLIVNAVEAMQGKGKLKLATSASDGEVQVSISDTGPGISPENMDKLFEPFFTTKPVGQGTGLGLSVSRGIVESHQGSIWATSEPGATTFHLRLPLTASSEATA